MINRKTGQIILEIPKCGSRSLVQAAFNGHGKKVFAVHGHHTLKQVLGLLPTQANGQQPTEAVAVIREPEERFYSQVNAYANIKKCDLDTAMKACVQQSHIMFKPQHAFLMGRGKLPVIGFPMEKMHAAQEYVAGIMIQKTLKQNVNANRKFSRAQVFDHPKVLDALAWFTMDYPLYKAAQLGFSPNLGEKE